MPFTDICDKLKGRYPKDFKFTGWHPHCRCRAVTILKTDDEIAEDTRRILDGEPLDGNSVNRVDDVPGGFKQWLKDNEERAKRSYSVPYFIKDNPKYLPKGYSKLYAMRMPYDTHEEYASALAYNKKHAGFSAAIAQNNRELAAVLPVLQGKIMNFTEADGSKCNPGYSLSDAADLGYRHNCQTCTMTYELRRRGDVHPERFGELFLVHSALCRGILRRPCDQPEKCVVFLDDPAAHFSASFASAEGAASAVSATAAPALSDPPSFPSFAVSARTCLFFTR